MKNKFRYNYSKLFKFILAVFLLCWALIFFFNLFRILQVFGFYSHDLVQEITCIAASVFAFVLWVFLITLKYKVDDKITLKFGPFDLTRGKFKIENMMKIVQSSKDDRIYINLYVDGEPQIAQINISPKNFDDFAQCIKNKNNRVLFDKADIE